MNSAFINASRNLSVGEHAVRATKWVVVNKQLPGNSTVSGSCRARGGADVARLNDDAQWIILMGFLVSFSFFFLAMVINQSTIVGQTTAESVIEFPKNDIRDVQGCDNSQYNDFEPWRNKRRHHCYLAKSEKRSGEL